MKKELGNVLISKTTTGEFHIEVSNSSGDTACRANLTAEQFAHAVTGKSVKCEIELPQPEHQV